jgi:hypothetical protein
MRVLACGLLCATLSCTSASSSASPGTATCKALGEIGLGDGSTSCSLDLVNCNDGLTYSVVCPGPPAPCTCQIEGGAASQFDGGICGISPTSPSLAGAVNQSCGWDIR